MPFAFMALIVAGVLAFANGAGAVNVPSPDSVLKTLRSGHSRLILTKETLEELRSRISKDPVAAGYRDRLVEQGEKILAEPPVERVLAGSAGMLNVSFRATNRIPTLALLYRLDGDRKWARRAVAELRAVAAFADWNHASHFLDVAEMTAGVSFGYDWLYDVLTPEDRVKIRTALVEKGLKPSLPFYRGNVDRGIHVPWAEVSFNWNLWCNGAMVLGALAVAEDEPVLSTEVVCEALRSMPIALESFAPDGGYPEGPSYWAAATQYTLYAAYALRSALAADFGIMDTPGLSVTGYYPSAMTGPSGEAFNYADAATFAGWPGLQYGLALWYGDPVLTWLARKQSPARVSAFDLIWYSPAGSEREVTSLSRDQWFKRIQVATFRSSWTHPDALFLGFKAGSNAAAHAHLDLGSFVFDALGVRWADDLGRDNYDLPGYWDYSGQRGSYYRLGTMGHNTLLVDGKNQDPNATAKLIEFCSRDDGAFAIADLTAAYAPVGVRRLRRGVALRNGRTQLLVQDEVSCRKPVEVIWSMHTRAEVELGPGGATATLTREGKTLHARLLSPTTGAIFYAEEVTLTPPQLPAKGERKLLVRLPDKTTATRIVVALSPAVIAAKTPRLVPLDEWARCMCGKGGRTERR